MNTQTHIRPSLDLPPGDVVELAELTGSLVQFLDNADHSAVEPVVVDLSSGGPSRYTASGVSEVSRWERTLRRLETSETPTVALVDGYLAGPTLEIALACDIRIATSSSVLALSNHGDTVWPGTAIYRLAQLMGPGPARRLVFLAQELRADLAHAAGIVDLICTDLNEELTRVEPLLRLDDVPVVRRLIEEAAHTEYDEALGTHLAACDRYLRRNGRS